MRSCELYERGAPNDFDRPSPVSRTRTTPHAPSGGGRQHRVTAQQKTWLPPLESWTLTTQLYRPPRRSSTTMRSMVNAVATTASRSRTIASSERSGQPQLLGAWRTAARCPTKAAARRLTSASRVVLRSRAPAHLDMAVATAEAGARARGGTEKARMTTVHLCSVFVAPMAAPQALARRPTGDTHLEWS
jgi:hypothetical protein